MSGSTAGRRGDEEEEGKLREENEEEGEGEEEVIAMPVWPAADIGAAGGQPIKQPPMEPIPEDEEESGVSPSTSSSFMVQSGQSPIPEKAAAKSPAIILVVESPTSPNGDENGGMAAKSPPTGGGEKDRKCVKESRQRLREVYTTEEIDTLVSTLPKESVPLEWENLSSEEVVVDPKMAHTYVTELAGGLPSARGSKYSYTYESRLEDGEEEEEDGERKTDGRGRMGRGGEEGGMALPELAHQLDVREEERAEREERRLGEEVVHGEDGLERHSTSTQKITRVTKITTTRSVKQIPVEPGDIYFDADGNPILNGFDAETMCTSPGHVPSSDEADIMGPPTSFGLDGIGGIDLSRTYLSEHEEQFRHYGSAPTTSSKQTSPLSLVMSSGGGGQYYAGLTPSAPGEPQMTELTESTISLAWLRPDFEGSSGPLIGYRVEFRRSELEEWDPAHDDLLSETECKITNLDPDEHYQFRVLGANMAGFGPASRACTPIRLREQQQQQSSTQFGTHHQADRPPPPPGRPEVVGLDADRATIQWSPSPADPGTTTTTTGITNGGGGGISNGRMAANIVGYLVEYCAAGASTWLLANDRPIREHRLQVLGLRPNGEYEFRVVARDEFGRQSVGPSSGPVRIRPPAPIRQVNGFAAVDIARMPGPPGEPKVLESGPNWVHLHWQPGQTSASTSPSSSFPPSSSSPVLPNGHGGTTAPSTAPLAYLVEMREVGEPRWSQLAHQQISPVHGGGERVPVTTTMDHFIVENLLPDSAGYEFRVWSISLLNGLRSPHPSPTSESIRLRPLPSASSSRKPPERPSAPEFIDYEAGDGSLTLCWLPAKSVLPVQGYEVEFRDPMQDAKNWYRMTEGQLVRACKTSIGSLLKGHQYQFRVLAKNAVGLSEPSDPSPLVTVPTGAPAAEVAARGGGGDQQGKDAMGIGTMMMPLMEEMHLVRESPPLPDRDDSPPPIYRQTESSLQWRDPTLKEVIDYLKSPDQSLVLDASGYLQHLTFNNDAIKEETRNYGGIECLIALLRSDNAEILRNVCGCLKNLAFGKANDANKRLIHQKGGLKALAQLLRGAEQRQNAVLVHDEATGALWNISSADDLKEAILNQTAETIIQRAVLPYAAQIGQSTNSNGRHFPPAGPSASSHQPGPTGRNPAANVFRNATGILRNISAVNDQARRFLRSAPGLVDVLLNFLEGALQRAQLDTRATENVVCLLRNLSYRVQEVVDPKYDPNRSRYQIHGEQSSAATTENGGLPPSGRSTERSRSAPSGSPKASTFGKKQGRLFRRGKKAEVEKVDGLEMPAETGPQRLWHPSTVRLYLRVLQDSADCEILEASAAAIQNLAGCPFDGSVLVRQTVRTEKGLPILVELLRLREDRVVCAVCCALRNLALDQRNLDLIGRFALEDLLLKIPDRAALEQLREQPALAAQGPSDATIGAILGILWEAVRQSGELARAVHVTANGTERLRVLARAYPTFGRRVCKYATQVLFMMWRHKELHELFRQSGLAESDFYSGTLHTKGGGGKHGGGGKVDGDKHSPSSMATTLARPFSSQGLERPAHLALASSRMDDSVDVSHYGAFSTPPQSVRITPPSSAAKPPRQPPLKNGQQHFEPSPVDHLYASVQKGNGHHEPPTGPGRRRSIDSWV